LALAGDAGGEHAGGEAAGLEDDDLALGEEAVIEEYLGDLRGLAGAGGGLENYTVVGLEGGYEGVLKFKDGQVPAGHGGKAKC